MVILDVVLREFPIVLLDLAFDEICRVGFLQQDDITSLRDRKR